MAQQKSGSFRQREAERLRRFIAARQLSGATNINGGAPLKLEDPIKATEEADAIAAPLSHAETANAHQQVRILHLLRS